MNFTDLDAYSKRLLYASLYLWLFKPGPFIGLGRGQTGDRSIIVEGNTLFLLLLTIKSKKNKNEIFFLS